MTNRSSNRTAVPEAKGALDKFKYEVANELGVPLSEGYNGDLTSRQNGSVGGYMVKDLTSRQNGSVGGYMVNNIVSQGNMSFFRNLRSVEAHHFQVDYHYQIAI